MYKSHIILGILEYKEEKNNKIRKILVWPCTDRSQASLTKNPKVLHWYLPTFFINYFIYFELNIRKRYLHVFWPKTIIMYKLCDLGYFLYSLAKSVVITHLKILEKDVPLENHSWVAPYSIYFIIIFHFGNQFKFKNIWLICRSMFW